jgi:outer membrane protein assembly factor BamD
VNARGHALPWCVAALALLAAAATGCANKKNVAAMGFASATVQYQRGVEQLQRGKLTQARTTLQQVSYTAEDDRPEIEPLVRIGLADATFYQRGALSLIDARNLYLDFVTLFADHRKAPYAQFQAGICSLNQVAAPSKDQTETRRAVAELREVERRFPGSNFAGAAQGMRKVAEANLAEHEYMVGRFYLKRKKYLAAADRFRGVLEQYPHYAEIDKIYLYLGQALLRSNNESEARVYLDKLVTDYPDGRYAEEGRKALSQAGGALEMDVPDGAS